MAVRIRLKKMGRRHRPFFRVCAMDSHSPRGGKVLEELGTYDPMLADTDARAILNADRIDYWLGVGAQPTEKVGVLIKKYGSNGSHVEKQKAALETMAQPKVIPEPGKPASMPKPPEPPPEPATKADPAAEKKATEKKAAKSKDADAPAPEAAVPEAKAPEPKADEAKSETAEVATEAPAEAAAEAPAEEAAPAEPAAVEPAAEAASDDAAEGEAKKES